MTASLLVGLDAGGGSLRALVLDPARGPLASARRSWSYRPAPGTGGIGTDLDLEHILGALADATREALARAAASGDAVVGIAVSAMRFATVVLDAAGEALLAVPNRDGRAAGACFELAPQLAALHARTGHGPTPFGLLARLRWLARDARDVEARAAHALALSDWIAWRLCGVLATDFSQASTTGVFDLAKQCFATDLVEAVGARPAILPPIVASGSRLGPLGAEAAERFGLRAGIAVAAGGADTQCALLGAGATAAGQVGLVAGTSAPVQLVSARAIVDPEALTWTECHLLPGRFVIESNAGPLGESLEWTARLLFADSPQPLARLFAEAALAPQGARGALANFGPPISTPPSMGLPVTSFAFSPLVAADDPERRRLLARAALEGVAFSLRSSIERCTHVAGAAPHEILACGGMTASASWLAVLSDVLDAPIRIGVSPESSAIGAALCAGVGAGLWSSLDHGAEAFASRIAASPDPARSASYRSTYAIWRRHADARAAADAPAVEGLMPELLRDRAGRDAGAAAARAPRILATADLDPAAQDALAALGPLEHVSFREAMRLLAGPALAEALDGVEIFVTEIDVLDAAVLEKAPSLRVVAACRGDVVNVDVDACTAYGIPVLGAPGRNADAVADLAVAYALMLLRKLPEASAFLRQPGIEAGDLGRMGQAFGTLRGRELWGKTVGLVGLGAVGRGVARRLAGFGARVVVHDPFVSRERAALADTEWLPLDELLGASDLVSLHAPVTDATRDLIDAAAIARMKPGAFLVNTARAALVDETALFEALRGGHLAGAALDVFAVEPPGSSHPLLSLPNVIATPHVGGNTHEVAAHQGRIVVADLARLLRGERPENILNPDALDGFSWHAPRRSPDAAQLAALASTKGPAVSDLQREDRGSRTEPVANEGIRASGSADVLDKMQRILEHFVAATTADPDLDRFAADRDATLFFTLTDLGLCFWLRLRGGISGALGAPESKPEVDLKLRADVLDGMFTGRVNPMQAAMNGRLSFTGDAAKAMTLQQIQPALSRHYRAARDAVGDPGDLAALPASAGLAGARSEPKASEARPVDAIREELVQVVRELYAQELITATGGNVSARIPGTDEIWITPGQLFKGDLRPEILVRVGLDGTTLETTGAAPSSECMMHCAVYRARPDAMAVVHAHAAHATILANTGLSFVPISTEAAFFGEIPRVPFIMPGTAELAAAVEEAARTSWAVMLVNHGLLVAGRSLRRAADMVEIVDRSCQLILGCHAVGKEPPQLPAKIVAELRALGDLVA